jgi:hypothetical protein
VLKLEISYYRVLISRRILGFFKGFFFEDYINSLRSFATRPDVQADRVRREGWGRERFVTDRPGPALPNFDLTETRSRPPAQTSIASSCIGNYLLYNAGFPICFFGALIPFYVYVFVAAKKSASV